MSFGLQIIGGRKKINILLFEKCIIFYYYYGIDYVYKKT